MNLNNLVPILFLLIHFLSVPSLSAKIPLPEIINSEFVDVETRHLPDITKAANDSIIAEVILTHLNKSAAEDRNTYYGFEMFYPADSSFKIVNVFGEYTGGASYNPFAQPFIIRNKKILRSELYGEVFRTDKISGGHYLFYCDDYSRMGSDISVYDVYFEADSLRFEKTSQHGNYMYDLIVSKKESLNDQRQIPQFTYRFTDDELVRLKLDTNAMQVNEYYRISEEEFLKTELNAPTLIVYYRHSFGDQLEKVLRIENDTTHQDLILAMVGGDSDYYTLTSEFKNDSVFVQTLVNTETLIDGENVMGYGIDSAITWYRYNEQLQFVEVHKDSFYYETSDTLILGKYRKYKTSSFSKPYAVNGLNCVWVYNLTRNYDDSGKQLAMDFTAVLMNEEKKIILTANEDVVIHDPIPFINEREDNFKDLNFDGFKDCLILNQMSSGSGGEFYDAYIFNPITKSFEFSEKLSGGNPEINDSLKTVTYFLKAGFYNNGTTVIHFGTQGKVLFTEEFSEKDLPGVPLKIKYTYKKIVNGKVVKSRTTVSPVETGN